MIIIVRVVSPNCIYKLTFFIRGGGLADDWLVLVVVVAVRSGVLV